MIRPTDWDQFHVDLRPLDFVAPNVQFSHPDSREGSELLRRLGVEPGQPHVCLAIRDADYLDRTAPHRDWSYHSHRDSRIDDYVPMAEWLANQGFAVLRMGQSVAKALPSSQAGVIDYATSGLRSDLGDAYIFGSCEFCISTSTGMDALAAVARRPTGFVNSTGLGGMRLGQTSRLVMPKRLLGLGSTHPIRLLDPRRQAAIGVVGTSDFAKLGLEVVDNSPVELLEFAREMVQVVTGEWRATPAQETLEAEFRECIAGTFDYLASTFHFPMFWLRALGESVD
jgi:putative glycosyltransferase (TIGR04372 family)